MKKTVELIGQHGIKFDNMVSGKYGILCDVEMWWPYLVVSFALNYGY